MTETSKSNCSKKISTSDKITFGDFFETWLVTQRSFLEKLNYSLSSQNHQEAELESLVGQVLSHYQHYNETKSRAASENAFLLFSSPWLSSYERSFLWITGFKPGVAFPVVDKLVGGELSKDQVEKIKRLKAETSATEKALSNEMARIQESVVSSPWVEIVARSMGDTQVVLDREVDQVFEKIKGEMRDLVVSADFLRVTTARELVDILNPVQAAKFLGAIAQLQLMVHDRGLLIDANRMAS